MMNPRNIEITVWVDLPWHNEPIVKRIEVEPVITGESLHPLPRDREIVAESAMLAIEQRLTREKLVKELADILGDAVLKAIESRDPQCGYSPEQWEKINIRGEKEQAW